MSLPKSVDDLRGRAARLTSSGVPVSLRDAAKASVLAWLQTAVSHGMSVKEALRRLRDGEAAIAAGRSVLQPQLADPGGPASRAACAPGCAFCCILRGDDGGTITRAEAVALHAALSPLAGAPDGRAWHPAACPALDPETRMCRAYEARPMICRTYISDNVAACEAVAEGTPATGPGVLGAQPIYLSVMVLTRQLLKGMVQVPTFSMRRVAEGAVEGAPLEEVLEVARHVPRELDQEMARQAAALGQ